MLCDGQVDGQTDRQTTMRKNNISPPDGGGRHNLEELCRREKQQECVSLV